MFDDKKSEFQNPKKKDKMLDVYRFNQTGFFQFEQHCRKENENNICESTNNERRKCNTRNPNILSKYIGLNTVKFDIKVFILAPQRGKSSGHGKYKLNI